MNFLENELRGMKWFVMLLVSSCAMLAGANPSSAGAARYDETCGLLPGEGAYGYVRVANMTCRHGKKVTNKARKKFCKRNNDCVIDWESNIEYRYRGTITRNGWRCKVTVGWEYYRTKCRKGKRRVIASGGA